jgi:hypothetical protein
MKKQIKITEWILRVGVFGTFLGHGYLALGIKNSWIPLLTSFGFADNVATRLMPIIGMLDIFVAICVLCWSIRIVLMWAIFWAFAAAFSRIVAGEQIWEFVERFALWGCPLALLVLQGFPKNIKDLFSVRSHPKK